MAPPTSAPRRRSLISPPSIATASIRPTIRSRTSRPPAIRIFGRCRIEADRGGSHLCAPCAQRPRRLEPHLRRHQLQPCDDGAVRGAGQIRRCQTTSRRRSTASSRSSPAIQGAQEGAGRRPRGKAARRAGKKVEEPKVQVPEGKILRPGMKDERVVALRKRLDIAGDKDNPLYDAVGPEGGEAIPEGQRPRQ